VEGEECRCMRTRTAAVRTQRYQQADSARPPMARRIIGKVAGCAMRGARQAAPAATTQLQKAVKRRGSQQSVAQRQQQAPHHAELRPNQRVGKKAAKKEYSRCWRLKEEGRGQRRRGCPLQVPCWERSAPARATPNACLRTPPRQQPPAVLHAVIFQLEELANIELPSVMITTEQPCLD